jgi:HEAT repeat protein
MESERLTRILTEGDADERKAALLAVHDDPEPQHLGPALVALGDVDPTVRRLGVRIVESLGDARAAAPLVVLLGDHDPGVASEALRALCSLRGAAVREELARALWSTNQTCRSGALLALREQVDDQALPGLLHCLSDAEVRRAALWLIIRALADAHWSVRREAVRGLGTLGVGATAAAFAEALDDVAWEVQKEAALALGMLGGPAAHRALLQALDAAAPDVRKAAVHGLMRDASGAAYDPATQIKLSALSSNDVDAEVRKAAQAALRPPSVPPTGANARSRTSG